MIILVLSVLMGCSSGKKNESTDFVDDLDATQKIEVVSREDSIIATISDNKELENFVEMLKIEDWEWDVSTIPSDTSEEKTFKFYRKDASNINVLGKGKNQLYEVATLTTYEDVPYITFQIHALSLNAKIPTEVHQYLNEIDM